LSIARDQTAGKPGDGLSTTQVELCLVGLSGKRRGESIGSFRCGFRADSMLFVFRKFPYSWMIKQNIKRSDHLNELINDAFVVGMDILFLFLILFFSVTWIVLGRVRHCLRKIMKHFGIEE
jgi:hypothetical protein